jgi:hypothetical protein
MDYHCCIGAFLYPWSYTSTPLADPELQRFKTVGNFIRQPLGTNYDLGTTYEILGYYAEGTSKDFYYASAGTLAFTFEGKYGIEKNNLAQHVSMWDSIFGFLAQTPN